MHQITPAARLCLLYPVRIPSSRVFRCATVHRKHAFVRRLRAGYARAEASPGPNQTPASEDLNLLHTELHAAVASQDFSRASQLRDRIAATTGTPPPGSWEELGLPPWLADRARQLGFTLPTTTQARAIPALLSGTDACVTAQTGSGKTLAFVLPALAALDAPPALYPEDLEGPQVVIIVPTRDLGVQVTMLMYQLLGGSLNRGHVPGTPGNMFNYSGPRGIKVRGQLLPEEVEAARGDGYLDAVHAVVGTPELIAAAMQMPGGVEIVQHAKLLVIDEADACAEAATKALDSVLSAALGPAISPRPAVVLVGASLAASATPQLFRTRGWLRDEQSVIVPGSGTTPLGPPASVRHRYIAIERKEQALATLCRQLQADYQGSGPDEAPPRTIVFAPSEAQAAAIADPLRRVLWGAARLSVLLPGGADALRTLSAFRDGSATLLVTTPAAARGLDLPAVQAVYCLGPPADAAQHAHVVGRLGRIGGGPGTATSLVTPGAELEQLRAVAAELGVRVEPLAAPEAVPLDPEAGVQRLRKGLDDLFSMY
ncbi:hypothetical protein ACKKBF_B32455 [Auxenochlorella protothecoides x Auxenochlorella symbiontica]